MIQTTTMVGINSILRHSLEHVRSWMIQNGKALTTYSVRHFWDQNAHGRPVVNVDAVFAGSRKMPGGGKKYEGQTHVYSGLDLSAKESRTLTFRTSSEKLDAVLMVFDKAAPKRAPEQQPHPKRHSRILHILSLLSQPFPASAAWRTKSKSQQSPP